MNRILQYLPYADEIVDIVLVARNGEFCRKVFNSYRRDRDTLGSTKQNTCIAAGENFKEISIFVE